MYRRAEAGSGGPRAPQSRQQYPQVRGGVLSGIVHRFEAMGKMFADHQFVWSAMLRKDADVVHPSLNLESILSVTVASWWYQKQGDG